METNKENASEKNPSLVHLTEGVNPIMACIGTRADFEKDPGLADHLGYWGESPERVFVNYEDDLHENTSKGITNAGQETYAISPISDLNKFSLKYKNCMGVIAAGQDKITGKNISFLTHQGPVKVLPEGKLRSQFLSDFKNRLKEIRDRSVPGTIDAVIFGGNYFDSDRIEKDTDRFFGGPKVEFEKNYKDLMRLLSSHVCEVLGFQPIAIVGPKTTDRDADNAIYDNDHRRLYLRRPEVGEKSSESFSPEELEDREKDWRKEWKKEK